MAHECPDCGMQCYCGGDIDDCCFNFDDDVDACEHCASVGCEDDDYEYADDDEPTNPRADGGGGGPDTTTNGPASAAGRRDTDR